MFFKILAGGRGGIARLHPMVAALPDADVAGFFGIRFEAMVSVHKIRRVIGRNMLCCIHFLKTKATK